MHDPPAYVWAIIIAGPTAIAATTCIALYGGAKRAGQGRAGHGRQYGRHGLLAAHPSYRTAFLVTAALILPAEFPHSVSDPGQCTRARVRGEGPVPADREG